MNVRMFRCRDDLFPARVRLAVGDVVIDAVIEQYGILRHDADGVA